MQRFKIKLNGIELQVVAMSVVNACVAVKRVEDIQTLMRMEALERLFNRMKNMYRPDKDRFTIQLNTFEAEALTTVVVPYVAINNDTYVVSLFHRLEESLFNQFSTAINIYNSIGYAKQY